MSKRAVSFLFCAAILLGLMPAFAEEPLPAEVEEELKEELKWLQSEAFVMIASRREQKVADTAAAVYVVTREDIRRSGANYNSFSQRVGIKADSIGLR